MPGLHGHKLLRFISNGSSFGRRVGKRALTVIRERNESHLHSEVTVCIGGAIISEAHSKNHYMWSWQPEAPSSGYIEGPHQTELLPKKERDSLFKVGRALLGIHHRGRQPGSGRFGTGEDFEQAVFMVVAALSGERRCVTYASVGRALIASHGRNATVAWHAGDSPADPGRQFTVWCAAFERNPKDLLQRARSAFANGE